MNLQQLQNFARMTIPGAKPNVLDINDLTLILNNAVTDIVKKTQCLPTNQKFNMVAGQSQYALSQVIGNYLMPDKSGLWWNNGTQFTQVYPRTLSWLDINYTNWRSLNPGNPIFYTIDGDILTIVLNPNTSLDNGFWLYYIAAPVFMVNSTDFPFVGASTEIPQLRLYDMAILKFCKWMISPMINQNQQDLTEMDYENELKKSGMLFHKRPDIVTESVFSGPKIC